MTNANKITRGLRGLRSFFFLRLVVDFFALLLLCFCFFVPFWACGCYAVGTCTTVCGGGCPGRLLVQVRALAARFLYWFSFAHAVLLVLLLLLLLRFLAAGGVVQQRSTWPCMHASCIMHAIFQLLAFTARASFDT